MAALGENAEPAQQWTPDAEPGEARQRAEPKLPETRVGPRGQFYVDGEPRILFGVWQQPPYLMEYHRNIGMDLLVSLKIDDTVGAWPVHGLCGIWGGLATGIFGGHPMGAQIVGSIAIPLWAFVTSFVLFSILKAIGILRVSPEEEQAGLDISEHGSGAYHLPGMGVAGDD